MLGELLLVVSLVLLNGLFVAAEFAIVKVRASQLELKAKEGSRAAIAAQQIITHLNAYLSATQLGITLASLALGWFGEEAITDLIIVIIHGLGFHSNDALIHSIALPLSFVFVTILHIVFGELAPKSIAIQFPEPTTLNLALFLKIFYSIFRPFIWVLNAMSNVVLRIMGIDPAQVMETHSAEELKLLIKQGAESGALKVSESELIENVFSFNELTSKQIMVPRTKMVSIEVSASDQEIIDRVTLDGYSRWPVYRKTLDDIVGVIHTKDLLSMVKDDKPIILGNILRPAYFIPETKKISQLLKDFQKRRMHMAIVLDEFGGTAGIVTMEDVIEELVGEIQDEYDEEKPIFEKTGDKTFVISGQAPIIDVNEMLRYPLPEGDDFDTVNGLMNFIFGTIPEKDEKKEFGGYEFLILSVKNRMVDTVRITEILSEDD